MIYVPAENQMSVSMILKIMNNIYIPHLKWGAEAKPERYLEY